MPGSQVFPGRGEPIGLVVRHEVLLLLDLPQPEHEVEAPGKVPAQVGDQLWAGQRRRVARQRLARRKVPIDQLRDFRQQHLTGRVIAPGYRELETELIEAIGSREVAKPRSASPAVDGCKERGLETFCQELGV